MDFFDTPYIGVNNQFISQDPVAWKKGDMVFGSFRVAEKKTGGSCYVYILENTELIQRVTQGGEEHVSIKAFGLLSNNEPAFVAAKVPYSPLTKSPEYRKQFVNECRIWSEFGNLANVAQAYGVRWVGNVPILFMEPFLIGSLRENKLNKKKENISIEQALIWFLDFINGLKGLQNRGLATHGDVTPSNLLIDHVDGSLRLALTDLGLASLHKRDKRNRHTGTPGYNSPEQSKGEKIDWRSDQFSFAVSLYETITKNLPQPGDRNHISTLAGDKFKCLDDILQKCMSFDAKDRYQKLEELENHVSMAHTKIVLRDYVPISLEIEYDDDLIRAKILFDNGLPEEALKILKELPYSQNMAVLKAACLTASGRPSEAFNILKKEGNSSHVRYQRAVALYRMSCLKDCCEELESVLEDEPSNSQCLKYHVQCLHDIAKETKSEELQSKAFKDVVDAAELALKQSPEAVEIWVLKGLSFINMGEIEKAEAVARNALELDPLYPAAFYLLGYVYFKKNDYDAALHNLDRCTALETLPKRKYETLIIYARILSYRKKFSESADACQTARDIANESKFPLCELIDKVQGRSLVGANRNIETAIACLERAFDKEEDDIKLIEDLGNAYFLSEKYRQAKYFYNEALKKNENSEIALNGRIIVALREWSERKSISHQLDDVFKYAERLKSMNPKDEGVNNMLFRLLGMQIEELIDRFTPGFIDFNILHNE